MGSCVETGGRMAGREAGMAGRGVLPSKHHQSPCCHHSSLQVRLPYLQTGEVEISDMLGYGWDLVILGYVKVQKTIKKNIYIYMHNIIKRFIKFTSTHVYIRGLPSYHHISMKNV